MSFQGIHVEILFRRDVGGVGAKEARRDEERLVLPLLHQLDCLGRDHAVGLLLVLAVGLQPTEGTAYLAVGFGVEHEVFVRFVAPLRVDRLLPGRRVVEAVRSYAGGHVVVIDLAHPSSPPAMLHELLGHGDGMWNLVPEVPVQVVDLDGVRAQSRHHRGPGRVAQGQLIVCLEEANAGCGQPVQVRGLGNGVAVATQGARQVVRGDEEDVWLFGQSDFEEQEKGEGKRKDFHYFFFRGPGRSGDGAFSGRGICWVGRLFCLISSRWES